jgi:hypothetical protein
LHQARAMHTASVATDARLRGTSAELASSSKRSKDSELQVHHTFTTDRLNAVVVSGLTKDELLKIEGVSRVSPDM